MVSLFIRAIIISWLFGIACDTRVSEWVLLNAVPENYLLVYSYNGEIEDQVKKAHETLKKDIRVANIRFAEIKNVKVNQPYYSLYYRNRLFGKYNSIDELVHLTTSPLRGKIADEILSGKLCVMLYLETGDPAKDSRYRGDILNKLKDSPFRNIITFIELNRNSVEESHFVSMLLHVEDDLAAIGEPMLFGIFGRLKALEPLVSKGITEENVGYMIDFLTADCSCLIKDNMPGVDILFTNKWENPVPALVNRILDENPSLIHK